LPQTYRELRFAVEVERGQTMAEYAVVLGVITLAIVTLFGTMSGAIANLFQQVVRVFS
jgi:Flp pilus assembly pilin Flp